MILYSRLLEFLTVIAVANAKLKNFFDSADSRYEVVTPAKSKMATLTETQAISDGTEGSFCSNYFSCSSSTCCGEPSL